MNKLARVQMTHASWEILIKHPHMISGIPEDAKISRVFYDPSTALFQIIVESEAFAEVEDGGMIPILQLTVELICLGNVGGLDDLSDM